MLFTTQGHLRMNGVFTEEEKKVDGFDTFAIHSILVHDGTDKDCWAPNDGIHGCVFMSFKHQF